MDTVKNHSESESLFAQVRSNLAELLNGCEIFFKDGRLTAELWIHDAQGNPTDKIKELNCHSILLRIENLREGINFISQDSNSAEEKIVKLDQLIESLKMLEFVRKKAIEKLLVPQGIEFNNVSIEVDSLISLKNRLVEKLVL